MPSTDDPVKAVTFRARASQISGWKEKARRSKMSYSEWRRVSLDNAPILVTVPGKEKK